MADFSMARKVSTIGIEEEVLLFTMIRHIDILKVSLPLASDGEIVVKNARFNPILASSKYIVV